MKKLTSIIFVLLFLITACQSKPENDAGTTVRILNHKIDEPVGIMENNVFTITNPEEIQKDWEMRIAGKRSAIKLVDFKISKGITEGDSAETYYLLSARSADNKTKAAALLKLNGEVFYFETPENSTDFYPLIICEGTCLAGCEPMVNKLNDTKYLNCSSCPDCLKSEEEIR